MASASAAWVVSENGSSGAAQELNMDIAACPISNVAVFNDRAEVTRVVAFTPNSLGRMSLVFAGLTEKADTDTIRVNRTRGRCTILEVSFEVHRHVVQPDSEAASKLDADKLEVKRLQALVAKKKSERLRLQQAREYVESYLQTLVKESKVTELEQIGKALDFYSQRTADIDASLATCDREQAEFEASLEAATANCRAAGENLKQTTKESRDVTVQVDVINASEEVVMNLVYIVSNASWSPSYDIRVTSHDTGSAPALSLTYFALVKQSTGEDWKGCSISLSTATPSKSGIAPTPARKTVRFQNGGQRNRVVNHRLPELMNLNMEPMPLQGQQMLMMPQQAMPQQMQMPQQSFPQMQQQMPMPMPPPPMSSQAIMCGSPDPVDEQPATSLGTPQTVVADNGAGNTSFVVERKVNIDADNQPHKVTIAMLDLTPRFMYFTTPEQEEKVYTQVRVMNDSSYKLLASTKVAVFFNDSFVTTTQIKDTSPGEEINTFLGQDTSIKVEYKNLTAQHSEAKGFMSNAQSTKYRFLTAITNTKSVPVSVKVVGCVPRSNTDNIKVELQAPKPEEIVNEQDARGDNVTMQNAVTNNIVWVRKLDPGQKIELPLDYTVAWPKDKQIEIIG